MGEFSIGKKRIGFHAPSYFIADIAANHDGDLGKAKELIYLAAEAKADAAKFQNFKAAKIVSQKGFDSMGKLSHQATWKKSVYEVYEGASVSDDWTPILKETCEKAGIEYFTSPYDFESVDAVDPFVSVYKIGSGDITWPGIIEHICSKNKPVMIASGASTLADVERAMNLILSKTKDVVLMQCNTNYTGSLENFRFVNLNVLKLYQKMYPEVVLGLSDHTPGHATVLGAITLGARVIEKHFTDDNHRDGPDHQFSMDPRSWKEMVERSRELEYALGDGVKRIEENELKSAIVQRRALRAVRDLVAGSVLTEADFFPLRPILEGGYAPYRIEELVGKKLKKTLNQGEQITQEDLA